MADRNSARIFGFVFDLLAKNPTDEHKKMAREIYALTNSYDFCSEQMDADDSCIALGIAQAGIDPAYPQEGEVILWPGDRGYKKENEHGKN